VLTVGARDLPARQQTLRNTIDWSYNLLDEGERTLFARLGVFVGGSALEAAERVCNADGDLPMEVMDGIALLLDKSLLREVEGPTDEPRFTMLETIREYALERLAGPKGHPGEEEAIRRRHAAYYLALAEAAEPHLTGVSQQTWFERLEADHDNLRSAVQWTVGSQEPVVAARFGAALWRFWLIQGYLTEGRARLAALLALGDAQTGAAPRIAARAQALLGLSRMANDQSDYAAARAFCEESQAIWQELGDRRGIALAVETLGMIEIDEGEYREPHGYLTQSLTVFRELGDKRGMATSLDLLAWAAYARGDNEAARILAEQSLALFEELGDTHGTASILERLGWIADDQGDDARALAFFTQSLALFQELGDKQAISGALMGLGDVAWWQGDYQRASELYRHGLTLRQELGDKRGSAMGFSNQAFALLMQGDYAQAASLYSQSLALNRSIQYMPGIFYCILGYAGIAAMQGQSERGAHLIGKADALSREVSLFINLMNQTVRDRWAAAVRAQLSEEAFAAAYAEGQAMSLDQAIAEALDR
jgi:tetratricopeptide (TPR) repeat protein